MTAASPPGATREEWHHFAAVLGLVGDMLPVVPDPNATPTERSAVQQFGKIPSAYGPDGCAYGLAKWQTREILPAAVAAWAADGRYSLCIRAARVRAIDVDITGEELSNEVWNALDELGLKGCARRIRENSYKFLVPVLLEGACRKRIIKVGDERIEFLADGQQWVAAGSHPSGARYQWNDGLPRSFPALTAEQFETIWSTLQEKFGTEPRQISETPAADAPTLGVNGGSEGSVLTEIDDTTLSDLVEALRYEPLLASVGGNTEWSEVGYALLSLGALGRQLWTEFVGRAANVSGVHTTTAAGWWDAHISQAPRSDFRHIFSIVRRLGFGSVAAASDFQPLPATAATATVEQPVQGSDGSGLIASVPPLPERTAVPDATGPCTDVANAKRLYAHYGNRLITLGGQFHWFNGKYWERSETEGLRCAVTLGHLIKQEIDIARTKLTALIGTRQDVQPVIDMTPQKRMQDAGGAVSALLASQDGEAILSLIEQIAALDKWRVRSEMGTQINAALQLLRGLAAKDPALVDCHDHLFNCQNGTLDLRTGQLRAHDSADFITHISPIEYDPKATCTAFDAFVQEIVGAERAAFLKCWLGYCITGETREQKYVMHVGTGGNGKGRLIEMLEAVCGTYLQTAPSTLLVGSEDRHPTDVAGLRGARLVVSQEPPQDAHLRESFLKQLTGQDTISARFMRQDFFAFKPRFKINLLTNYKPVVKSGVSAEGVWRRVLVLDYPNKYGTQDQVTRGEKTHVADVHLADKLRAEIPGILTWLVQGAQEWYEHGLRPPKSIEIDTEMYRSEQDRVKQFVEDCCILDPNAWAPYSGTFGGLYPAYTGWCRENGYPPMGNLRFVDQLPQVVPGFRPAKQYTKADGVNKQMRGCYGLRVNTDGDGGGSVVAGVGDLV